jgi:hypothetical protein
MRRNSIGSLCDDRSTRNIRGRKNGSIETLTLFIFVDMRVSFDAQDINDLSYHFITRKNILHT